MAFTLSLDHDKEDLLKKIQQETGIRTKQKAIRTLVHYDVYQPELQKAYLKLKQENEVLLNVNFISKFISLVETRIEKNQAANQSLLTGNPSLRRFI